MGFSDRLRALFGLGRLDDAAFDELADLLVEGDLGAAFASKVSDELKSACRAKRIAEPEMIKAELKRVLASYGRERLVELKSGRLNILLLLGVNGVGKTTTCAKLAEYYRRTGAAHGVVLAAADTFRAAAIDQLRIHGERLGIRVVAQAPGSDPGAVLWDAIDAAKADGADLVVADTAGRMHTRSDLVRELAKMDKIVAARADGAEYLRLLVLDSTTGQNGLRQAEIFSGAVRVDGVVLTKHDSTAKGGMAIAIARELGLPTAFLGTGESYRDIEPFVLDSFLDRLIGIEGDGR